MSSPHLCQLQVQEDHPEEVAAHSQVGVEAVVVHHHQEEEEVGEEEEHLHIQREGVEVEEEVGARHLQVVEEVEAGLRLEGAWLVRQALIL